jgi:NitT/TauT family transport system permease protein
MRRSGRMVRVRRILGAASPWLIVVMLLLAWQGATDFGLADPRYLSRPSTVAGMLVAFGFFFFPRVAALCDPMVVVLNAAPRAILAPFAVLLFGIGVLSKMMLVLLAVFTITLLNLYAGLKEVDRTIVDNARVMGAGQRDLARHVYIPAALVWIVSAMRISIGQAFTAAIVCELLGATEGLGWIVAAGQSAVKPDWIMAGLFFAAAIVVVVDFLVLAPLERRGSHWRVF